MNIRLITIHSFKSKIHALWMVLIGRAVGAAEIIPDAELYKTTKEADEAMRKETYLTDDEKREAMERR